MCIFLFTCIELQRVLIDGSIGKITAMSFDIYGGNIYLCDEERLRIEVFSISTKSSVTAYKTNGGDVPKSVLVIPEHGVFFVAVLSSSATLIVNRINMDGTQIMPHITGSRITGLKLEMSYDKNSQKVFWFDSGSEIIECMNVSNHF